MSQLAVTYRGIDSIAEYEHNSRTHDDGQVDKIVASIEEFGFTNPLLVGPDNVLVAGHGRMMAARKMGIQSVPCIELGHLTDDQRRAYVIADNRLALDSGWDEAALASELAALNDADFNLRLLGFDELELDEILIDEESIETDGLTDDDSVPDILPDPVTSEGDVWVMGNHRLCCGDSTSIADVDKLLGGGAVSATRAGQTRLTTWLMKAAPGSRSRTTICHRPNSTTFWPTPTSAWPTV